MSAVAAPQIAINGQKPYASNAACRAFSTAKTTPNKIPMQMMFFTRAPAVRNLAQRRPEFKWFQVCGCEDEQTLAPGWHRRGWYALVLVDMNYILPTPVKPAKWGKWHSGVREGWGVENLKTGALNRSATLPSLEFSDLAGVWVRGKVQSPPEGTAGYRICGAQGASQPRRGQGAAIVGRRLAGLAECQREQTRAQQHKTGRRQRKESF
jgi:hypothetical protein